LALLASAARRPSRYREHRVRVEPHVGSKCRIVDRDGLANFDEEGVGDIRAAVQDANTGEPFAGLTAEQAVQRAVDNASGDPQVVDAVMQSKSGPLCEHDVDQGCQSVRRRSVRHRRGPSVRPASRTSR
jgi:hypothetical protein